MVELQTLLLGVNRHLDILKSEPFSNRILLAQEIDRAIGGDQANEGDLANRQREFLDELRM